MAYNGSSRQSKRSGTGTGTDSTSGGQQHKHRSIPAPTDPITQDEELGSYDITEFLCPGTDDRGQSVRLFFRVSPMMERELEILRDCKRFPYKTIPDIVRHAVHRHVIFLHSLEPDLTRHFLTGLDAVNEVMRDAELRASMEGTFQKLNGMIDSALSSGDHQEALRLMTLTRSKIVAMPDSRWKKKWMQRFSDHYAHHLQAPKPAATEEPAGFIGLTEEEHNL